MDNSVSNDDHCASTQDYKEHHCSWSEVSHCPQHNRIALLRSTSILAGMRPNREAAVMELEQSQLAAERLRSEDCCRSLATERAVGAQI